MTQAKKNWNKIKAGILSFKTPKERALKILFVALIFGLLTMFAMSCECINPKIVAEEEKILTDFVKDEGKVALEILDLELDNICPGVGEDTAPKPLVPHKNTNFRYEDHC